jgi:glycosyltransferase involved in cell wall biosynthesis
MKVLQLNTHNEGGSYEYAATLSRGLVEIGVDSRVLTRQDSARPQSDKVLRRASLSFAKGAWHGTRRTWGAPRPEEIDADVVHLHTVADWFDLPAWLARLPTRIRVVIGLHDLWHVSGGCFVHGACERFRDKCKPCPLLHFPANHILAADEQRRKRAIYQRCQVRFVANSQWLKSFVAGSTVVNGAEVAVIPPPVDTRVFRPLDRDECRAGFGLESDDLVVSTGCASLTDTNKDTPRLLEILAALNEPGLRVLVFGDGTIPCPTNLRVTWLGPVRDKQILAKVYSASDVFASASRMETYGLTLAEAQACGTQVVAYRVGGIPEAVSESDGARLCVPFDQNDFQEALATILRKRSGFHDAPPREATADRQPNGANFVARMALKVYSE